MMQKGSLPNVNFDSNRFDSLRLGSLVDDDATNQTNVMFTDPCSLCGNKKRRILTPQESRKKISIDPNSINVNSPIPRTKTSSSPPLIAATPNTKSNVNATGSLITTTPESKNNNNLGSYGRSSPATGQLPPRPPAFRRSVSDPTPSSKSLRELLFPTTVSGEPAEESPAKLIKRWKKFRERLTDMKDLVNRIVEDEDQEDDDGKDKYTPENDVSEVAVPEKTMDLLEGEDGVTLAVTRHCCCGKRFQFCLSLRSI